MQGAVLQGIPTDADTKVEVKKVSTVLTDEDHLTTVLAVAQRSAVQHMRMWVLKMPVQHHCDSAPASSHTCVTAFLKTSCACAVA